MKKFYTILTVALLATVSDLFIGCGNDYIYEYEPPYKNSNNGYSTDDIVLMAQTLRGHWDGNVQAQGTINGKLVIQNLFTEIEFDQYDITKASGRGLQSDYENVNAPQAQLVRKFSWSIERNTGNIIIIYDDNKFKMTIPYKELVLNEHRFSGVMYGDNDTEKFSFSRYTLAKKTVFEDELTNSTNVSK